MNDRHKNWVEFETYYETQWKKRRCCLKCEDLKIPSHFPKDINIGFCQDCLSTLSLEEKLEVAQKLARIQAEKENRWKY